MSSEIRVPTLGESVTEATIAQWLKSVGDSVEADEPLVELETDKVSVEVPAPAAGVLSEIIAADGETVEVGALLGNIGEGNGAVAAEPAAKPAPATPAAAAAPAADTPVMPSARKVIAENNLDAGQIAGTGKSGQITKADALAALESKPAQTTKAPSAPRETGEREERVKMTRLRRTIANRLKEAQDTAAMLTTFNEVDMGAVMDMRKQYKEVFEKKHGVKLGFMSFFANACITALKEIPAVNAEIDGDDLIYKNHYDIGVAVGTDKGLVVPVVRDADLMGFADIEKTINDFGQRARSGDLKIDELQGGTFTISNGGVYGSLMSTPILNMPQSGILGMHKIQQRPMAVDGEVQIRPMMYLALSYDHRIIDGKEAVTFLVRVKECLEAPERLVLDL